MSKPPTRTFGNIVAIKLFDRMIDRETRKISRTLEKSIAQYGSVRLLLTMESLGFVRSPESLYESLHFARLHADHIERIAIVGSREWQRTSVGLFGLFGGIQMEYFDRSEIVQAIKWLQQP